MCVRNSAIVKSLKLTNNWKLGCLLSLPGKWLAMECRFHCACCMARRPSKRGQFYSEKLWYDSCWTLVHVHMFYLSRRLWGFLPPSSFGLWWTQCSLKWVDADGEGSVMNYSVFSREAEPVVTDRRGVAGSGLRNWLVCVGEGRFEFLWQAVSSRRILCCSIQTEFLLSWESWFVFKASYTWG